MYEQVNRILKSVKNTTNVIFMWDFNASVGNNTCQREIGKFGLSDIIGTIIYVWNITTLHPNNTSASKLHSSYIPIVVAKY